MFGVMCRLKFVAELTLHYRQPGQVANQLLITVKVDLPSPKRLNQFAGYRVAVATDKLQLSNRQGLPTKVSGHQCSLERVVVKAGQSKAAVNCQDTSAYGRQVNLAGNWTPTLNISQANAMCVINNTHYNKGVMISLLQCGPIVHWSCLSYRRSFAAKEPVEIA